MNYWLVKSEPVKYPWEQFMKDEKTFWDGVRNFAARLHLLAMKKGDKVLFYHSNEGKCVMGIAQVFTEASQDPSAEDPRWVGVHLKAEAALKQPVTLAQIKKENILQNIALVRQGRLSVMPLSNIEFDKILEMGS